MVSITVALQLVLKKWWQTGLTVCLGHRFCYYFFVKFGFNSIVNFNFLFYVVVDVG